MTNKELGTKIKEWWLEEVITIRDMRGDDFPFADAEDLADTVCTDALLWAEAVFADADKAEYVAENQKAVKMCEVLAYCHLPEGFGDTDAERFNGYVAYIAYLFTKYVCRQDYTMRRVTSGKFYVNFGVCELLADAGRPLSRICNPSELVMSEIKAIFD